MSNGTLAKSEVALQNSCQHYWVIEPANGPTSAGRCRHCGELRQFSNIVEAADGWGIRRPPATPFDDADLELLESEDGSDGQYRLDPGSLGQELRPRPKLSPTT